MYTIYMYTVYMYTSIYLYMVAITEVRFQESAYDGVMQLYWSMAE